ncbi:hypothetical protein DOTSEDRAFT_38878 [Lecanosticta acicola]|uniref:F-box domain-containing protein n=1 Tax=Lecanosticta acicola TaxID=111012 RepID=A0AAI8W242_9PEZI|nr:hypothetical protein DOTSEDRAFT_38878 [Lecanosticta acicola]
MPNANFALINLSCFADHAAPTSSTQRNTDIISARAGHSLPMATTLTDLPPEVTEAVAQCLEPRELLPLRLVCRDVETKILRTFTRVHFTEKGFLLCSPASLQAAIDIAGHETFGPALQSIYLFADAFKEPDERMGTEGKDHMPGGFENIVDWARSDEQLLHWEAQCSLLSWGSKTYGSADVDELLAAFFKRLDKHNKVTELVLAQLHCIDIRPLIPGLSIWNLLGPRFLAPTWVMGGIACALDADISGARLLPSLTTFKMQTSTLDMPLQPVRVEVPLPAWEQNWCCLFEDVKLRIWPDAELLEHLFELPDLATSLISSIAASAQIKSLHIEIPARVDADAELDDNPSHAWLTTKCVFHETFPSLKSLTLSQGIFFKDDLIEFLTQQPVLEVVRFEKLTLWCQTEDEVDEVLTEGLQQCLRRECGKMQLEFGGDSDVEIID